MKLMMMVFAALAMATCARADVITLLNGNQLQGTAVVDGDRVKVQIGEGWVFLPKDQVKLIEKGATPQDIFAGRYAALDPKDADGRIKLAAWCRGQGLGSRSDQLLNEVLALDPNNADARRLLGYVQYQGKWVTAEVRNQAMGLVQFEGKWYSPEALTELLNLRAQLDATQAQMQPQTPVEYSPYGYSAPDYYSSDYYPFYYPFSYWPPVYFFNGPGVFFRNRRHERHEEFEHHDRDGDSRVRIEHSGGAGQTGQTWHHDGWSSSGSGVHAAPPVTHVAPPVPHVAPQVQYRSYQPAYATPRAAPPQGHVNQQYAPQGGGSSGHRR